MPGGARRYDSPRLVRAFEQFTGDLSNWYVRLSRARFWKTRRRRPTSPRPTTTLWYALVQGIRCVAPVMPFLADELWQNLVRGVCPDAPASVHLAGYPRSTRRWPTPRCGGRDGDVRTVVALGHSARNDAGIKLRQPLARRRWSPPTPRRRDHIEAHAELVAAELGVKEVRLADSSDEFAEAEVMPNLKLLGPKYGRDLGMIRGLLREGDFTLDDGRVDVGDWTLEPGEFELRTRAREGFAVVDGDGFAVALDTEMTPELRLEGAARDVIRSVQQLRKDAGLEVTDRIVLRYPQADGDAAEAFRAHGEWIAGETLAVSVEPGEDWLVRA